MGGIQQLRDMDQPEPPRLWVTLTSSTGDTAAITSPGSVKSRIPAGIPGVSLEAAAFPHVCSQECFPVPSQRKAGTHTRTPSSHTRPTSPPSLLPGTEGLQKQENTTLWF